MAEPIGELTDRMRDIFGRVIEAYLEHGAPVGSKILAGSVNLSPASIRGVMQDLEERGLLTHPHTSAGRIPTDKAPGAPKLVAGGGRAALGCRLSGGLPGGCRLSGNRGARSGDGHGNDGCPMGRPTAIEKAHWQSRRPSPNLQVPEKSGVSR